MFGTTQRSNPVLNLLRKLFHLPPARRRFPSQAIEDVLGPWEPYAGDDVLPRSRLPARLELPPAVAEWGDVPGARRLDRVLFRCWLRLDPTLVGFLLSQIQQGELYTVHEIDRPGKAPRRIAEPDRVLKFVQRRILERVLEQMEIHPAAHGFVKGRSIFTNAEQHTQKAIVIALDARDFFPTITFKRVNGMFIKSGFAADTAGKLAGLCCFRGRLPQGAPTSPMISNLICRRLDGRLSGLLTKFGGTYTRYGDDMTFSGPEQILSLLPLCRRILAEEGFELAPEKVRICRRGSRQTVTGLVVNDKVSVPRRVRRYIRAMVHAQSRSDHPDEDMVRFLRGHLSFMRPAHPDQAERLLQQLNT